MMSMNVLANVIKIRTTREGSHTVRQATNGSQQAGATCNADKYSAEERKPVTKQCTSVRPLFRVQKQAKVTHGVKWTMS